jgi:hypothetical protein
MEGGFSLREMLRELSEKSLSLLSRDITRRSRADRRRRECQRRGVHLSINSEQRYLLQGILGRGSSSNFSVNGNDVVLDQDSWVFGELLIGAHVSALISEQTDGIRKVKKIIVQGK